MKHRPQLPLAEIEQWGMLPCQSTASSMCATKSPLDHICTIETALSRASITVLSSHGILSEAIRV